MKILTWNIKHGGTKKHIDNIILTLKRHNSDVIILTEYRNNDNGDKIKSELLELGWKHQYSTSPPKNQNGVLVLSKSPFEIKECDYQLPNAEHRWTDIYLPKYEISFIGIHIPSYKDKWGKKDFWESIVKFGEKKINEKYVIIGDFNTGLEIDCEGSPFKLSEYMDKLIDMGWVDAWRMFYHNTRDFTWYSNVKNGFRIDYAFVSPSVCKVMFNAYHSHNERQKGYSDHSALVIELDI